ncbi:MAG: hypothetical protein QM604_03150 [Microbacterium sp.]
MSRMLACLASRAMPLREALSEHVLAEFEGLSRLHGDGSGYGAAGAAPRRTVRLPGEPHAWTDDREPGALRLLYLRFASRGAEVSAANIQPFLADGILFQHNGALSPRDAALGRLTASERDGLQGTTDSEVYFALVRRAWRERSGATSAAAAHAVADAVRAVRGMYPAACLNAMAAVGDTLVVVQSAGTTTAPLAAFAARGFDPAGLPAGHDAHYNQMFTTRDERSGARLIATTGIRLAGWRPLPAETVTAYRRDRTARVTL